MSGALGLLTSGGTPPSQKYRTIGFVLSGGTGGTLDFSFSIRPEDLRRTEPSRTAVQQTLGGALVDSFGAGLSTITMSGHNGWRGGFLSSGEQLFADLRAAVFTEWHARRKAQTDAGSDPGEVELSFVDTLDDITVVVAPVSFTLMRSKSSPLLMRYSIEMLVLADASDGEDGVDTIIGALSNPLRWLASVTGLGNVLTSIQSGLAYVRSAYALGQMFVGAITSTALNVLSGVHALVSVASPGGLLDGALAPVLASGLAVARATANVFHCLAADQTITNQARGQLMSIASDFTDAACTLANGFAVGTVYRSLDDLLGASNCSSTGGGEDWSVYTLNGSNPFLSIFATTPPDLSITFAAQAGLATLQGDVLTLASQPAVVAAAAAVVARGVTVNIPVLALAPA